LSPSLLPVRKPTFAAPLLGLSTSPTGHAAKDWGQC
jgi:hypothetical protein